MIDTSLVETVLVCAVLVAFVLYVAGRMLMLEFLNNPTTRKFARAADKATDIGKDELPPDASLLDRIVYMGVKAIVPGIAQSFAAGMKPKTPTAPESSSAIPYQLPKP